MKKIFSLLILVPLLGGCAVSLAPRSILDVLVVNGESKAIEIRPTAQQPFVLEPGGSRVVSYTPYYFALYRASGSVCFAAVSVGEETHGTRERCFSLNADYYRSDTWHVTDLRYPRDPQVEKLDRDLRRLEKLDEFDRRKAAIEARRAKAKAQPARAN